MMDYAKTASLVIKYVGGKNNIKSVTHCATRLRFQLRDNGLRNEEAISDLEGVKGVFLTQSQFQIIFGSGIVNMVCDEVQKQLGTLEEKPEEKEEGKGNVVQRFIKMLSDIFVPIIPAIVAGGLLMGLNNLLTSPLVNGQSMIELYPMWQGFGHQHLCKRTLYLSAGTDWIQRNQKVWRKCVFRGGHGHDYGPSGFTERIPDWSGTASCMGHLWFSDSCHRISGNCSSCSGCLLDSGQYRETASQGYAVLAG